MKTWTFHCSCGGRMTFKANAEDAHERLARFNRTHAGCSTSAKWRCGVCGCLLLVRDHCPLHLGSGRVPWPTYAEDAS